jgi:hypothetical protein
LIHDFEISPCCKDLPFYLEICLIIFEIFFSFTRVYKLFPSLPYLMLLLEMHYTFSGFFFSIFLKSSSPVPEELLLSHFLNLIEASAFNSSFTSILSQSIHGFTHDLNSIFSPAELAHLTSNHVVLKLLEA